VEHTQNIPKWLKIYVWQTKPEAAAIESLRRSLYTTGSRHRIVLSENA